MSVIFLVPGMINKLDHKLWPRKVKSNKKNLCGPLCKDPNLSKDVFVVQPKRPSATIHAWTFKSISVRLTTELDKWEILAKLYLSNPALKIISINLKNSFIWNGQTLRKTKRPAPLCVKYKLINTNIVNQQINISFFRDLKLHTGKHGRATIWTVQIFVKKTQVYRFYLI